MGFVSYLYLILLISGQIEVTVVLKNSDLNTPLRWQATSFVKYDCIVHLFALI